MSFFEPDRTTEYKIDYNNRQPVSVIAAFNPMGDFKPVNFGIMDLYGNICKVKIEGIKYAKEVRGGKSFCCVYRSSDQQKECILTYYVSDHRWVLGI
ncbi:hypothetical protein [Anaerocolumna sp. MB42-C2]|uniref:hypothetical protein n=1 Tax=Anaerocolumna sp. MB42-C2 TaxID=3070997 RepID=UPI0027E1BA91|nr:hypothetical protein [Anaerocolumna sp. MB42-C2]WMJ88503.1 hypothetical protein RBU59_03020 [Anaerocolumna sp. MB42-C2]